MHGLHWALGSGGTVMVTRPTFQVQKVDQNDETAQGATSPVVKAWNPRSKEGYAEWKMGVEDLLVFHHIREIVVHGPPTMEEVMQRADSSLSGAQLEMFYQDCLLDYEERNSKAWFVLKPTLDLSGTFASVDAATIQRRFTDGERRDAHGLFVWANSFKDCSSVDDQERLQIEFQNAKLGASASLAELETHFDRLLTTWLQIDGNDISKLAAFYNRLLTSMPSRTEGPISRLRSWLAERITDKDLMLQDPYAFSTRLLQHAKSLDIPEGTTSSRSGYTRDLIAAMLRRESQCSTCDCFDCPGKPCVCFAKDADISSFREGAQRYAYSARAFLVDRPKLKSLKGVRFPLLPKDDFLPKESGNKQATAVVMDKGPNTQTFDEWWAARQTGTDR